ncbi:MAG: hypothetical protein IPK16_13020 [Anaerolineales bacterium]|nr:hypothetical protein [Anaerolineales bacterium]
MMHALKWIVLCLCLVTSVALAMGWSTVRAQDNGVAASGAVVSIRFKDTADATRLAARYDVWYVDHRVKSLIAYVTPAERTALARDGYSVQVDAPRTAALSQALAPAPHQKAGIPNYACYRTVEETYTSMSKLAKAHPRLARWVDIGDSWLKIHGAADEGYDIRALVVTNRDRTGPKSRFFLMAAIHAREYATAETAARFAERLVNGYGVDPDITWLLDYTEIHIVTQSNPDGRKRAESGFLWRKNVNNQDGCSFSSAIGVDLNRNSSFKWAPVWKDSAQAQIPVT